MSHQQQHQGPGCVTTHWQQQHQDLGCRNTLTSAVWAVSQHWHQQYGLYHNTLTAVWAVLKHSDISSNTKAWAVSEHRHQQHGLCLHSLSGMYLCLYSCRTGWPSCSPEICYNCYFSNQTLVLWWICLQKTPNYFYTCFVFKTNFCLEEVTLLVPALLFPEGSAAVVNTFLTGRPSFAMLPSSKWRERGREGERECVY